MSQATSTSTFEIPACNIAGLVDRIAKLNKRADKLGMPSISYELGAISIDEETKKEKQDITITGEAPVIDGWEFLASVEYLPEGGEVVSSAVGEFQFPACYRNRKPFCEHCETHRVKRYTFLLQNIETQEYMNVGRTCLQDFLGGDIDSHVSSFSYFTALLNELRDLGSDYYDGTGGEPYYSVRQILATAAYEVENNGYRPTSNYEGCTRDAVFEIMIEAKEFPSNANYDTADIVFQWIMDFDAEGNDFILNCQNLFRAEYVRGKMFGYVAGAMGFYVGAKRREDRLKAEARDINNEHFGEVKKRYTMDLTMIKQTNFEGYYGTTWVYTFLDTENRCFVWFASKQLTVEEAHESNEYLVDVPVEVNATIKVKATVKDHNEYKGIKQTVVTRVAIQK